MEAMMPSIVRGLRAAVLPLLRSWISPMVITLPLLLCGLLMAGTDIPLAVLLTVLTTLAAFVGVVSAAVLLIWLIDLWK
jgi:ABC-type iron transport system FetAB permease component